MSSLEGIFVPTIAPYDSSGGLAESELRRIINWLIENGVSGLYPNGSLGEFIRLSYEERKRVVTIIAEETRGRVPILSGAAEANLDLTLEMCQHCADLGCRAVSITGPYYYNLSQEAIESYFRKLAEHSPIDIVIYNIPMFSNEISLPVLKRLALDCPRIIGTKDSSKDLTRFMHIIHQIKSQRPDFACLIGWEELLVPSLFMGGDGGTLSTTGVAPEVIMKIYDTAKAGLWDEAREMQYRILDVFQAMITAPNFPEGFRAGYEIRGFNVGPARFPTGPEEDKQIAEMHNRVACLLAEFGFAEAAEACAASNHTSEITTGVSKISPSDIERIVEETVAKFRQHR
jgi:dihydrodipicolinate synthase/N-acetylneuraminate lyase